MTIVINSKTREKLHLIQQGFLNLKGSSYKSHSHFDVFDLPFTAESPCTFCGSLSRAVTDRLLMLEMLRLPEWPTFTDSLCPMCKLYVGLEGLDAYCPNGYTAKLTYTRNRELTSTAFGHMLTERINKQAERQQRGLGILRCDVIQKTGILGFGPDRCCEFGTRAHNGRKVCGNCHTWLVKKPEATNRWFEGATPIEALRPFVVYARNATELIQNATQIANSIS